MSKVMLRGTAMLAVLMASLVFAASALAQMPTSPWKKGAPFPEADEELYGVASNGTAAPPCSVAGTEAKRAASLTSTTRPPTSGRRRRRCRGRLTMPPSRPRTGSNPRDGRLRSPEGHRHSAGRRMGAHRQHVGVRPGDRFLEVAAAAARQARVGGGRRSRRQDST